MVDTDTLRLAALVCSRLIHDVVGPAGAIANGLELMAEPAMAEQALELTRTTSEQLNRRLAFYRRAWGTGDKLTWDEAYRISAGLLQGGRHELDWQVAEAADDAVAARLALNMLLCLMDATPLGARLTVTVDSGPRVAAEGEVRNLGNLRDAVAQPMARVEAMSPRDAQPVLTARLAQAGGRRLALTQRDDEHVMLSIEPI